MGVYIPPPNDKDDKGSKDKASDKDSNGKNTKDKNGNSNNNNNNNTNVVKPTTSPPVPPNSTTIVIPNPAGWIPHNPSAGLFWGPLTPASDNRPALYGMTGLQFAIGLACFRYARLLFRPRPVIAPGVNGSFITPKGSILKALIPAMAGAAATYGCGLELSRLMLPYDPWYEEAKHYRRLATKNNDKPNAWFGAYDYYTPMTTKAWIEKVGNWIKATEKEIEHENQFIEIGVVRDGNDSDDENIEHLIVPVKSNILSKLNEKGKYAEIYQKIKENSAERYSTLLSTDLKDVSDLNKAERIDLILEGKSPYYNPDYTKQHIQLGNNSIETDDDFDMVWLNFDPWDELKLETNYDIRLIPQWRWEENAALGSQEPVAPSTENSTSKSEDNETLET